MGEVEKKIGGISEADIRKSFFGGKLSDLIAKMQSKGEVGVEEFERLEAFLAGLKAESENLNKSLQEYMPEAEDSREKMFLSEVLNEELSEDDKMLVAGEKKSYVQAVETVVSVMKDRANQYYLKKNRPSVEDLMDDAAMFIALQYYVDGEETIRRQLYKKRIAELVTQGNQRKQAEDLAMLTVEYRRWMDVYRLRERMLEYIMLAKKRFSGQFA